MQQQQPHNGTSNFTNTTRAPYQICGKSGHQALDYFHKMNYSYQGKHPPPQLAAMATQSNATYDEDQEWLADSGANAYITNNLENLTIQQPFEGNEMFVVGNEAGLKINNAGATLLHNLPHPLNSILKMCFIVQMLLLIYYQFKNSVLIMIVTLYSPQLIFL
jgi:hypothetical protein